VHEFDFFCAIIIIIIITIIIIGDDDDDEDYDNVLCMDPTRKYLQDTRRCSAELPLRCAGTGTPFLADPLC